MKKRRNPRRYVNKAKVLRKKAAHPPIKFEAWVFRPFRMTAAK